MKKIIHPRIWYQRPLRCLLGMHEWRLHPAFADKPPFGNWWYCCSHCEGEKEESTA